MTWPEFFTKKLRDCGFTAEPADQEGFAYYGPELGQTLAGFYVKRTYAQRGQRSRFVAHSAVSVWVPLESIKPYTADEVMSDMDKIGGRNPS